MPPAKIVNGAVSFVVVLATTLLLSGCQHGTLTPAVGSVQLDGREWSPVQKNAHPVEGRDYLIEFLPANQTTTDWQEMVTVQLFSTSGRPIDVKTFEQAFVDDLQKTNKNVGYNLVSIKPDDKQPHDILLTWKAVEDPKLHNQEGIVRIMDDGKGIHILQYTSQTPMTGENKEKWEHLLQSSNLEHIGQ